MIKSLLEEHADQPERSESKIEQTIDAERVQTAAAPQYVEVNEADDLFEAAPINAAPAALDTAIADDIEPSVETINFHEPHFAGTAELISETPDETADFSEAYSNPVEPLTIETKNAAGDFAPPVENQSETTNFIFTPETDNQKTLPAAEQRIVQSTTEPQSFAETARQSGLAYAAAITLFASVVFMLIVGWFADLLFGSSPWGKVGGIVLGSLIGFVQLFRITSQIFKNKS